jgi:hypothetical protein
MTDAKRLAGRRWFQISLKSLFLLTLLVAAYFAGYRTALRQAEDAQAAEREARLSAERAAADARKAQELAVQYDYLRAVASLQAVQAQRAALDAQNLALAEQVKESKRDQRDKPQQTVERVEPEER